jgi:hypothetical protein
MKRIALLLALVPFATQAAKPACVEPHDMRVLLRMALPDAIEGLAARCKAVLPSDAFLPTEGAGLAERFRREAPVDPARARKAVEAATGQDLSSFADDATVLGIAHNFVETAIEQRVATRDCDAIDAMVSLAAPLRADAMSEALLIALEAAKPGQIKGLAICGPSAESAPR